MRVGKTLTSRGWLFNKLTIKQHSSEKHLRRCTFDDEEDEFFVFVFVWGVCRPWEVSC